MKKFFESLFLGLIAVIAAILIIGYIAIMVALICKGTHWWYYAIAFTMMLIPTVIIIYNDK